MRQKKQNPKKSSIAFLKRLPNPFPIYCFRTLIEINEEEMEQIFFSNSTCHRLLNDFLPNKSDDTTSKTFSKNP